jgi:hypothetical protein
VFLPLAQIADLGAKMKFCQKNVAEKLQTFKNVVWAF